MKVAASPRIYMGRCPKIVFKSLVTSHQSLTIRPCFQIFGVAISRIVIPSAAEGSFLHCGQYHIGTVRKRRLGATHILCLSVCKEDFSLALEMTIRESDVSSSPSLLVTSHSHTKSSAEALLFISPRA